MVIYKIDNYLKNQQKLLLNNMRPVRFILFVILLLASIKTSSADSGNYDIIKNNIGFTLSGMVASVFVHELGHFLVAEAEGVDAYFDGMTIRYKGTDGSDKQRLHLSSAGYQAQWALSEYAFHKLDQPNLTKQKTALNIGFILGHVAISAAYLTVLRDHEDGDVEGVANASSLSSEQMVSLLAIPALLDTWRLFGDNSPRWSGWVSKGIKGVGISAVWLY